MCAPNTRVFHLTLDLVSAHPNPPVEHNQSPPLVVFLPFLSQRQKAGLTQLASCLQAEEYSFPRAASHKEIGDHVLEVMI